MQERSRSTVLTSDVHISLMLDLPLGMGMEYVTLIVFSMTIHR